ncbi:MAG: helix-turn-helix domain-containing protein [Gammaproteobacteria bacterium]
MRGASGAKLADTDIAALNADTSHMRAPLRDCVRDAVERYFDALDGHECERLFDMVICEVEKPLLEVTLEYTNGNQAKAARLLGLNRGTLHKKLIGHNLIGAE